MAFTSKTGWRDFLHRLFVTPGKFSLRPLPTSQAEKAEAAANRPPKAEKDLTRLKLDSEQSPPD
jgi:hypothetical protein